MKISNLNYVPKTGIGSVYFGQKNSNGNSTKGTDRESTGFNGGQPEQDEFKKSGKSGKHKHNGRHERKHKATKAVIPIICLAVGAAGGAKGGAEYAKLSVPEAYEEYSYIDEYINDAAENETLSEETIEILNAKEDYQKEYVTWFRDGDFVYCTVISDEDISISDIEKLLDVEIKDLTKYNNLLYYNTSDNPILRTLNLGEKNYEETVFSKGDVIKIPLKALGADGIDLEDYEIASETEEETEAE